MSNIFKTKRKYNLGLSATPEREDFSEEESEEESDDNSDVSLDEKKYNASPLGQELGPIIYNMSLKDAYRMGILPPYEIRHYGLPLTAKERRKYEQLTNRFKMCETNFGTSPSRKRFTLIGEWINIAISLSKMPVL